MINVWHCKLASAADIYNEEDDDDEDNDDEEDSDKDGVPDWVESEKEQFKNFRDKNMDGYLDLEEVRAWVIPEDYDNSKEETKHLFRESDMDRVGVIDQFFLFCTKMGFPSLLHWIH